MRGARCAVIGDRVEGHPPQDAIAPAIEHAAIFLGVEPPDVRWVATKDLRDDGARLLEGAAGAPTNPVLERRIAARTVMTDGTP